MSSAVYVELRTRYSCLARYYNNCRFDNNIASKPYEHPPSGEKPKIKSAYSSVCVCVCFFSSHSFWTSSSLDVPAGVTQEEGNTGFLIHLLSAVRALIFLARRILPFLSLVDREVEFLCTNDLIVLHPLGIFSF